MNRNQTYTTQLLLKERNESERGGDGTERKEMVINILQKQKEMKRNGTEQKETQHNPYFVETELNGKKQVETKQSHYFVKTKRNKFKRNERNGTKHI